MESKTCYLIDDDDDDREAFETALFHLNQPYRLITAVNGVEALKTLSGQQDFIPDYIFLDLHMPVIDGKHCLSEIRKISRLKDTKVAMYTTANSPKDREDFRKLGAVAYIDKSHNLTVLKASLNSFFREHGFER